MIEKLSMIKGFSLGRLIEHSKLAMNLFYIYRMCQPQKSMNRQVIARSPPRTADCRGTTVHPSIAAEPLPFRRSPPGFRLTIVMPPLDLHLTTNNCQTSAQASSSTRPSPSRYHKIFGLRHSTKVITNS